MQMKNVIRDFADKNVFIVGGSSGIGLAAGKMLAERGANILVLALPDDLLQAAPGEIGNRAKSPSQKISAVALDVSAREEVERVMGAQVDGFGVPDVLINCAGLARPNYFEAVTYQQFDRIMKINVYGTWNTASVLVPHMKNRGGYIVNVSSIAGFIGVYGYTDYCTSKFAVLGFSEALRSELKPLGIGVSVLCPPDTDTPGLADENPTKPPETRAIAGTVKLMTAEQVAGAMIRGMERGTFLIVPSLEGRATLAAKRWFPSLVASSMDRTVARCTAERGAAK
jgi:NAD(P)-dependent dehydrogenase (short-subunit alcohol dehydrogenase family)